jgi:hypothetical protein
MKTSLELTDLAAALVEAQFAFPVIPKDRDAKIETRSGGTYAYKYADLGDVILAVRPMLHDNGLAVVQGIDIVKGIDVITTRLLHKSGQWIESTMRVPGVKTTEAQASTPQAFGSGLTYGKRYAYSAMLNIVTDTDDDGTLAQLAWGEGSPRTRKRSAPRSSTPTTGRSTSRPPIPQDPETAGKTQMSAADRNKIIKHLAHLDPPVTGDAVAKHVGTLLGRDEPVAMAKLEQVDGDKLFELLGIER